jgi:hypothetical protein
VNDPEETSGYCEECGKKLPPATAFSHEKPTRSPAYDRDDRDDRDWDRDPYEEDRFRRRDELSPEQQKARKEASGILFAVAVLQVVCGGIALAILPQMAGVQLTPAEIVVEAVFMVGVAVVFAGLGVWARFQPLPPAILGLILYILLSLGTMAANPELIGKGLVLRIIIIIGLGKAIQSASKAR